MSHSFLKMSFDCSLGCFIGFESCVCLCLRVTTRTITVLVRTVLKVAKKSILSLRALYFLGVVCVEFLPMIFLTRYRKVELLSIQ